ncbi:TetR/AcrR family transcriptional regulator [Pseudonocardia sp. KRD291]|uniref:TetR/AcrR family transcriptional regulator n=1 Tax=Pseudonocardia sp. KRD291 TaxID=2792007 RepID=UPI001C4A11EA|nr:TetR/AcrR family transcriptional regulator [Pseudonocardia sp. KRD291]MBW0104705.1 TetR/AcrR family transcriptional regulator [Pseudonocardia sp. KRD291]
MARTARGGAGAKVLETAYRLFYRDGIHAVGVDAIAAEAGVTKTALYSNFGSKARLVVSYLRERDRLWQAEIDQITASITSPRERVLAVFDAYEEWLSRDRFRGCAFANAAAELPRSDDPAREVVRHHKSAVRSFLRRQVELLPESGPELPARLMILLEGAAVTSTVEQGAEPFRVARRLAESLLPLEAPEPSDA